MKNGKLLAFLSYFIWGLLPIYWRSLKEVPPFEILCHRIIWSLVFTAILLTAVVRWKWFKKAISDKQTIRTFLVTSALIFTSWYMYIWAVNSGYIVEASLGYFINPLMSVSLGVLFLKEKLNRTQLLAIFIALFGICYLTVDYGSLPWISLLLASVFSLYGLFRKTASLESLEGVFLETLILTPIALGSLLFMDFTGRGVLIHDSITINILLVMSGPMTSIPLLLFAAASRKITLTSLGFLQYILPTMQYLIGVFVYHETMTKSRLVGFIFIWIALLLYTINVFVIEKRKKIMLVSSTESF